MRQYKKSANPFYALLVAAGVAFVVTAAAYCVMAYREREAVMTAESTEDEHPLMIWMSQHGTTALLTELGILAVCTFGAIGTDDFWQRRAVKRD
jgi:hypothetical protein